MGTGDNGPVVHTITPWDIYHDHLRSSPASEPYDFVTITIIQSRMILLRLPSFWAVWFYYDYHHAEPYDFVTITIILCRVIICDSLTVTTIIMLYTICYHLLLIIIYQIQIVPLHVHVEYQYHTLNTIDAILICASSTITCSTYITFRSMLILSMFKLTLPTTV